MHATILQVTPALDTGGVEGVTIDLAQAIAEAGGKALVASRGGRLAQQLARVGGEHIELPMDTKNPWTIWQNATRLAELCRARSVDVIHAHSRAPAWSALWAARRLKTPFVTTYHGIYQASTPMKRFYNSVMARGDVVIANSRHTRDRIIATYGFHPARVVVIYQGVDVERFDPARVSDEAVASLRRNWGEGFVFLLPARLTPQKGHALAIEALARMKRRNAARLVFAGDAQGRTAYAESLVRLAAAHGVAGRVHQIGHVDDMPLVYKAADAAIFPSITPEPFGRSAVEAQAVGRPVIAADEGGFPETIAHGETGLLFAARDAEALAGAMDELAGADPETLRRMGAQARSRVTERFSGAAFKTQSLEVYERILRKAG